MADPAQALASQLAGSSPAFTPGREALRPIHDKVMQDIAKFGSWIAPKQTYLSLTRRSSSQ
jgi:hypothetical protein